jgi:isoleucyl-tRNA synthetase
MGVHHAWGRTLKDIFQRYHAMLGQDQRFQNGFDCQGLWVEVEVEKSLGINTKGEIYSLGLDNFVRECKLRVLTYAAQQTQQSIRLGQWADWDDPKTFLKLRDALKDGDQTVEIRATSGNIFRDKASRLIGQLGKPEFGGSYFTFADENNYSIWSFLKKCHDNGFIYRGHDVMPWCTRCGTGVSQMEVAEGRRIVAHTSVFVRFPLISAPKTALLVWTTTPWTLPANVAVAVNPKMTYLKVRVGEWTYFIGKVNLDRERIQELEADGPKETHKLPSIGTILRNAGSVEIVAEVSGEELVGLEYRGPFDDLPAQQQPGGVFPFGETASSKTAIQCHRVIPWSEVSETEGTGLVHIAPGCGTEDQKLGAEHDLVFIAPIDDAGVYLDGFGFLSGKHCKDVADSIILHLKNTGLLAAKERYPHVYPHCWRCKQELVFRPVDEWFISMSWRERIQRLVPQIRWFPAEGEAREADWLRNMGDWMISKKRFWGLALPIWECESCAAFTVIGSKEELKKRAIEGWEIFDGHTPHRPFIDAVKIKCDRCGMPARRVEDVGTPWLDAGIVPFTTLRYSSDRDYWSQWFPADLVIECFPGQFRNWFYSLLAMSAMLDGRPPFKVLLGYGIVRDARGEEMHKSKGNAIAFDDAAEVFGADVMRYIFARQKPWINLNFPDLKARDHAKPGLDAEVRRKLLTFWNCYTFFVTYANVDGWVPNRQNVPVSERNELDRWIISRLHRIVAFARHSFEEFSTYRLLERLEGFFDELSNWYLRRSRRRFWKSEMDRDKSAAYQTLYETLGCVIRVFAPILPFLSEELYQSLVRSVDQTAPESVHLTDYPAFDQSLVDEKLETSIDLVINLKNIVLNLRTQAKIKIRQPVQTIYVKPADEFGVGILSDANFATQVLEECNAKTLQLIKDEYQLVSLELKPNPKTLGSRFGKEFKAIAALLGESDPKKVALELREKGTYELRLGEQMVPLAPSDLLFSYQGENLVATEVQGMFVALDTRITPELEDEGIVRDFNRHLQEYRKSSGLNVGDRILVKYSAPHRVQHAISEFSDYLYQELLAESIQCVESLDHGIRLQLAHYEVAVAIERSSR